MNSLESCDIQCPYCGEVIEVLVDCSEPEQAYVEDCQVCCRPINFYVTIDEEGTPSVAVSHENE